jgi:phenylalanyl-tRNA synthetase beta chain
LSWLREFVPVTAGAAEVGAALGRCGFEVAGREGDVLDVEVTANRPDCLSVYGLAREVATSFGLPLAPPPGVAPDGDSSTAPAPPAGPISVAIEDGACGRYALGVATVGVGASPGWLAERVQSVGLRSINNVVDVTNLVMMEMGQPLHAFDAARLSGSAIRVRLAHPGERLTTLDGVDRALEASMLVIADAARAQAIAGVMGGAASEVSMATTTIALESAWFAPGSVRATSRRLGLKTDAAARFERGGDIEAPVRAIRRALDLLERAGAGGPLTGLVDVYPSRPAAADVTLRRARIRRVLGCDVDEADVLRILGGLGFGLSASSGGWTVRVPSFRVDVAREADLIEEVGRHVGFDSVPYTFPALGEPPRATSAAIVRDRALRRVLSGAGFLEAVTFTFIEEAAARPFVEPGEAAVALANPLSEKFAVLRPSLVPGLLDAVVYNRRREASSVTLFEVGSTFRTAGESSSAAWILTGDRSRHWAGEKGAWDLYDSLGVAELVAHALGLPVECRATDATPWYVPGRSGQLVGPGGMPFGSIGELLPEIVAARGLPATALVVSGEIDLGRLPHAASATAVRPLPRMPSIVRDLSVLVDEHLPAGSVRGTILAHAPDTLVSVREFDRYRGKGLPDGRISLSLRLTFRAADRTLTDEEVQAAITAIVGALGSAHGAALRGKA